MPSIVLDSFSRASIRFEKLATQEADRLAQLQTTAQIDIKEARSVPFKAGADRLGREISDIEFELSKAEKLLGGIETSLSAIDSMRAMVDRIKGLEDAAAAETSTALATSYTEQIAELKEQMKTLGETASFRGNNFFSNWDQDSFSIGGQNFAVQGVDINDVVSGFAYRGGNVLGIENGEFDTSAYSNLVAAYGPDIINNSYVDFTGNFPDGILQNGAVITADGPNGGYGVDTRATIANNFNGSHVQLPTLTIPADFTISTWAKVDTPANWGRVFDFSNNTNSSLNSIALTREGGTNRMIFHIHDGTSWRNMGADSTIDLNWAYWTVSAEAVASIPNTLVDVGNDAAGKAAGDPPTGTPNGAGTHFKIYKDGTLVAQDYLDLTLSEITRDTNYFNTSWSAGNTNKSGYISDFTIFNHAQSDAEVEAFYENVGKTGLEKSFFTMDSEALSASLDKIEAHLTGVQVGVEATRNQLAVKSELYAEEATSLLSIDSEEVAIQSSLAGMRQTLAVTSLGITSSTQANILNLFG